MNRFATVVENASGATTKDVSSAGQATASPAKGEKNTTKDAKINLQNELVNLLCFDVVEQYHNNKLLFDKYYEKMLKRRKSSKIINCDVITQKGPILLKVYREDGTIEVIANFKTRMEYPDQTERELKIDFNKPLKEQDPLNELNELANKKRKRTITMSSATSDVTYTSIYTDSEPDRAFWGTDDEEDEDEREAMFIQPHDPDYVPEPIYPEYIPLEDEHVFPVEEQPLPPVDSPTAESPGYVTESDPEEDPEEYEDDETEDGPVDYPMDGGDDDDGDSSRDDADDEDGDEEEEEEHPAPADSAVVIPTVELVSPPEGTEPVIPPPSTDISTTGARITVRLQASISLPPEAEVERLLAIPTPPPSPPISLSPPSAGERLARCTAPPALSSPPPVPSPLLPSSGCPTQIQTLRIASTQALVDAVTAALPSPPLPPLPLLPPSLYISPPVDRRDDIPESEHPPRKRLCLSTLGT
ncbi:hypothetical protein Tco_0422362 [Tanacetum coccineum]